MAVSRRGADLALLRQGGQGSEITHLVIYRAESIGCSQFASSCDFQIEVPNPLAWAQWVGAVGSKEEFWTCSKAHRQVAHLAR